MPNCSDKPLQVVVVGENERPGIASLAPSRLPGVAAKPGGSHPAAGSDAAGRSPGVRQRSRRRDIGSLCLRRPGLLAADNPSREFARNSCPSALAFRFSQNRRGRAMAHAIRFEKPGSPDVLSWQQVEVGKPGQGQVRLRHKAVGLNYIDTYQRSGLYSLPLPSGLGSEGAGVVEEVGPRSQRSEAGRPRRLCRGADRRLRRRAGHASRPPGPAARRHYRPPGCRDDAERNDRMVSRSPHSPD